MPLYKVTSPDGRVLKIRGPEPPSKNVLDNIFAQLPPLETQQVKEETIHKPNKFDDISPFLLYSPLYIPFLVLLIFTVLIIKKKIKSGWARIGACVSIMWTLFWGFYFLLLTPGSTYSHIGHYNSAISEIETNILWSAYLCLTPFVLFFIIYRTVKWIREGFKEDKND